MSQSSELQQIQAQLAERRTELTDLYLQALRETLFTSRTELRPARLRGVASDETEVVLKFFQALDQAQASQHGAQLCQAGLGDQAVLRLGQVTRRFCHTHLGPDLLLPALEVTESYHSAVMQGFAQEREALTLVEQERIRAALQKTLVRTTQQMETAAQIARAATSTLDLEELLSTSAELVRERFDYYYVGVFLVDEYGEWAVLRAASGEPGQELMRRGHKLEVGGNSMIGWCVKNNQPRIALDIGQEAIRFNNPLTPETRSEMALPLTVQSRVIGAMTIQSSRVAAFSDQDVAVLNIVADQLANAIENSRLLAETQARLKETQATQRRYLQEAWAGVAESVQGFLYEQHKDAFAPADDRWLPEMEQASRQGRPVVVTPDDQPAAPAVVAAPITLRGEIIGNLGLSDPDPSHRWTEDELALIDAVTTQLALALENARLFTETRESEQRTQALYKTSRALSSALEQEAIIRTILESVRQTLGCEYATLSLVDEQAGEIETRHGIGQDQYDVFPEWIHLARYPLGHHNILADIYRSGRTEVISEWDDRFDHETWTKFGLERLLRIYIPLKVRERVLGVIEVGYDKQRKSRVDEEEIQTLTALVDQAAVALENANLLQQAQRRAWRERLAREIGGKLQAAPDVEAVLQTAVRELGRIMSTPRSFVQLGETEQEG
jgi:GAF domain-containing protein